MAMTEYEQAHIDALNRQAEASERIAMAHEEAMVPCVDPLDEARRAVEAATIQLQADAIQEQQVNAVAERLNQRRMLILTLVEGFRDGTITESDIAQLPAGIQQRVRARAAR